MSAIKPPFAYYGGKTTLADRIVSLLPDHAHYAEPFAGSLAVLLAKPRSPMETVNDLEQDLVTFWRVLRDRPAELRRLMELTPHGRAEHQLAYEATAFDDLERARRIWVLLSQGRGGTLRSTGWRFYRNPGGSSYAMPDYLAAYAARVPDCALRLQCVSLECRDALEVIADYGRHPGRVAVLRSAVPGQHPLNQLPHRVRYPGAARSACRGIERLCRQRRSVRLHLTAV